MRKTVTLQKRARILPRDYMRLFITLAVLSSLVAVMAISLKFVFAADPGALILTPNYGPTTGGTSVTMTYNPDSPGKSNWSEQSVDFVFTGGEQTFTAPVAGEYKLEVWGAQGQDIAAGLGGPGGYSTVTVRLNAGQTIYLVVGGQGTGGTSGYNGGGGTNSASGGAGGGASHIALSTGLLTAFNSNRPNLLLVAGGGGGAQTAAAAGCNGGAGGGTNGIAGSTGCLQTSGGGGTQSAGGSGTGAGAFGQGGSSTQQGGSNYGGGGGGGFFGGGAGNAGRGGSGGGGSGYFQTVAINGSVPTNGSTIAGNTAIPDPNSTTNGTMVGRYGDGYARVTILAEGVFYKPKVYMDGVEIPAANVSFVATNPSINEPGSITFITPAHAGGTADITLDFDKETIGEFFYWVPATSYTNECTTDDGATWSTVEYTNANTPTRCRIVLNNSFDGTISLSDDYYDTVDASIAGSFASSDSRFNSSTNTFTITRADSLDSAGQTLEYTYTSPTWNTLVGWYNSSNHDDLFWPGIEVTATPDSASQQIALSGEPTFLGLWAETYKIIQNDPSYNTESEYNFTISTYGAPYEGTITFTEDLSHSDDPGGTPGVFRPSNAALNFANSDGANMELYYTPYTTGVEPNHIEIKGTSAGPAIIDDMIDIYVVPATIYLSGPSQLSRGETGQFTLRVDIAPNFAGTVTLDDILASTPFAVSGVFTDTTSSPNPTGTFNPATNTYTFSAGETYLRSFDYTMPNDTGGSLSARLTATSNNNDYTFFNIAVTADKITLKCPVAYPSCYMAYIGESKDYVVQPNGIFTGDVTLSSTAGGSFGLGNNYNWEDSSTSISTSYTPGVTGRHYLSAVVSNSTTPGMNGNTYLSTDTDSLNNYLWVIANEMTITGDNMIANAGNGYFTLSLNGPYQGNINIYDTVSGVNQNGSFDNGGVCRLTFADYHPDTNTTSCTFMYTPTVDADNRNITLTPSVPTGYGHAMSVASHDVLVYGYPQIDGVAPDNGVSTGGTSIYITGSNLTAVSYVTLDGLVCSNLRIISDEAMSCQTPARGAGTVDIVANGNIANSLPYTYFNVATDYVNECSVDGGITWESWPYVNPGTTVPCRIILNGRFQGTISITDDYYDTIDSSLAGVIASADQRFHSDVDGNNFSLGYPDTADELGRTLEYTYTSPSWAELKTHYEYDGSTDDDLFWPLLEVEVVSSDGIEVISTSDDVIFGLYAQEYYIAPDGYYDYYCISCEVDFIVSTYGAPYEGTITFSDNLSNSDVPTGGTPGTFWTGGQPNNPADIDFSGSDGADSSFSYIAETTAEGAGTYIGLCGSNSDPAMLNEFCYNISPVLNPGITIVPDSGFSFLNRGQTGTYTLTVTLGSGNWSGTVVLDDFFDIDSSDGNGVFADTSGGANPVGTFNPATKTYTFTAGAGETYERTFSYTLRDDSAVGPTFPSHIVRMTADSSSPANQTFTNIFINANGMKIRCAASYPNCNIGYVGVSKDYSFSPNGAMSGSVTIDVSETFTTEVLSLGKLVWPTISASSASLSYIPRTPGRRLMTVTVDDSNVPSMVDEKYYSTDANSLNDYIWVMANSMALSGPSWLKSGATGEFTLTMNGPFIGEVGVEALLDDSNPAGGELSNNGVCSFSLSGYDEVTNTTSCTINYTPNIYDDSTMITLVPSAENYEYALSSTSTSVLVYGKPIITSLDPDNGPTAGGNVVTLTGENLAQNDLITVGNIAISSANYSVIDNNTIMLTMPPNSAGPVDIAVTVGARVYHHPDIYTYTHSLTSITPNLGPTAGGTGFGVNYNPDGTVTITGDDLLPSERYSDGTTEYIRLNYIEFDGSQYIDTGVSQLGNTKMTIDATRDSGIGAAGIAASGDYFMLLLSESGFRLPTARYGDSSDVSAGGTMNAGDRILATLNANGSSASFSVSINGSPTSSNDIVPASPPSTAYNIYLGRVNNGVGGASAGIVGKVYGFAIDKDGDANDRNFVPVCSENDEGGMFDTLHNIFYPASSLLGSTPFTCNNASMTPPVVTFDGTTVPDTNVMVVDSSTITVIPPAHIEGLVDVDVTINGYTASLEKSYTFQAPLSITTINPPTGPPTGGTTVTITGTGFTPSSTVGFDGLNAQVTYVSTTSLRVTTPAHAEGEVDVTVANGVENATFLDGFEYIASQSLNFSLSKPGAEIYLEPAIGGNDSTDVIVATTYTDSPDGYELTVTQGPDGSNLECLEDGSQSLPTTSSDASPTLDLNTWGLGIGTLTEGPDLWRTVSSNIISLGGSSSAGTFNEYVYFGARADFSQSHCTYTGIVVTFTVLPRL